MRRETRGEMEQKGNQQLVSRNEIVFELFASVFVVFVVVFFWEKPDLAFLGLITGVGLQLYFWKSGLDMAVMVLAGIIGAPAEVLCIKSGLWSYHAPGLVFGIPIWLPLVWAYLICLFHRLSLTLYNALNSIFPDPDNVWLTALFSAWGLLIIVYYIASMLLIARVYAIIFTLFMVAVTIFRHSRKDIVMFTVGAILGTTGEFICMKLGFWHYHHPRLRSIGLPLSLPLAWGLSTVMIVSLAEQWIKSRRKRLGGGEEY